MNHPKQSMIIANLFAKDISKTNTTKKKEKQEAHGPHRSPEKP
jgi:hypothetical protein